MKLFRKVTLFLFLFSSFSLFAQKESLEKKSGWNVIPLPVVSYNSDLGFQFGALATLYDFGDGSVYPDYKHRFYFELSMYTKMSGIAQMAYDSKYLIPGYRLTANLGFFPNKAYAFYGYNGYQSVFKPAFIDSDEALYRSRLFYNYQNYQVRFMADLQRNVTPWLKWIGGFNLWYFDLQSVDIDFLNRGKEENLLPSVEEVPGLYDRYVAYGIIPHEEAEGGLVANLKLGIVADTRDYDSYPTKGVWTELLLNMAPGFIGNKNPHVKLVAMHRQYFPLVKKKLVFAYRLGYQGTIAGHAPFYMQSQLQTSFIYNLTNVAGGSKSVRGILYNRVLADGFLLGNAELRWRAVDFRFLGQNCFLGFNFFSDAAVTVQEIEYDREAAMEKARAMALESPTVWQFEELDYFEFSTKDKPHFTVGGGLKFGFNENTIVSLDVGKALDARDGNLGVYVAMDFLF